MCYNNKRMNSPYGGTNLHAAAAPITRHISTEEYNAGWRLACLAQICGDAEIAVPDIANAYRSRMKIADLSSPEENSLSRSTQLRCLSTV